jgi:hypothetical protein
MTQITITADNNHASLIEASETFAKLAKLLDNTDELEDVLSTGNNLDNMLDIANTVADTIGDNTDTEILGEVFANSPVIITATGTENPTGIGDTDRRYTVADDELDSDNLPWDERINTVKRTKTQKGVWKLRKGVDKTLVEQVKAE